MNKLDEILQKYRKEVIAILNEPVDKTISRDVREAYIKQAIRQQDEEAKQAIIELIEGEIIGEDIEVSTKTISDRMGLKYTQMQVDILHNKVLMEQKQKLQKLKE